MLIDEMLTIADLDRGTVTLKPSDVDLAPILRHVAKRRPASTPSRSTSTSRSA